MYSRPAIARFAADHGLPAVEPIATSTADPPTSALSAACASLCFDSAASQPACSRAAAASPAAEVDDSLDSRRRARSSDLPSASRRLCSSASASTSLLYAW